MKLNRTLQRHYDAMFGVLPPAAMHYYGFLVGEPTSHNDDGPLYASYWCIATAGAADNQYFTGENMTVEAFKAVTLDMLCESADDAEVSDKVQKELDLVERYSREAVDAYLSLNIEDDEGLENFEEAYQGEFSSDREFAENAAEEMGLLDKEVSWPYTCIDWDYAARELMYDYSEADGYYFRNL